MATYDKVYDFDFLPDFSGGSFAQHRLFATIGQDLFYLQNSTYPWILVGSPFGGIDRLGFVSCNPTGNLVYVGREDQGGGNGRVYRSADGGINFLLDYTILNIQQVSAGVFHTGSNNLFVGTHAYPGNPAEIHRRTPGGLWSLVHTFPSTLYHVTDLFFEFLSGDLYATVNYDGNGPGEVWRSQDGGTTWSSVWTATGVPLNDYPYVTAITYFNGLFYVLASDPGVDIYTYTSPDGNVWTENAEFTINNPGDMGTDLITNDVSLLASMGNLSSALGLNAKIYCTTDGNNWILDNDFNIPPWNNGTGFTSESSVSSLGYDTIAGKYYCGIGNIGFPETSTYIYSCPTADIGAPSEPSGGGGGGG